MALSPEERALHAQGVQKANLKDGAYYAGRCRNATVARWNATTGRFYYERTKFGRTFTEHINCPEDDNGLDLFFPMREIEPIQIIPLCADGCEDAT